MSDRSSARVVQVSNMRPKAEFEAFYVAVPLLIAMLFPPDWMFPALFFFAAVGIVLLRRTPGFRC